MLQRAEDGDQAKPVVLNTGTHVLPLYTAPVPDVRSMIADPRQRCGRASVKLLVAIGNPRPASVTSSEESDSDADDADPGVSEVGRFILYCLLYCTGRS